LSSEDVDPEKEPRAFPEVTLNARDKNVLRFTHVSGGEIDFEAISEEFIPDTIVAKVSVKLDALTFPVPPLNPQISRIDGNHRLSQAQTISNDTQDESLLEEITEALNVPFALYVGMTAIQERKIFAAYNGKHKGMPAAIIDNFETGSKSTIENIREIKSAARWLAVEIQKEGHPFYGKVHLGGAKLGAKQKFGEAPPLTNRGLATAILTTLEKCNQLTPRLFPAYDPLNPNEDSESRIQWRIDSANKMLSYLDLYWSAVRDAFPAAWDDKKNYILMSSIGIGGFSQLAAPVIENLVVAKGKKEYEHFRAVMDFMAKQVTLDRDDFKGIAGAGGIKKVATSLIDLWSQNEVHVDVAIADPLNPFANGLSD